jgi:anhydro-N-acetylmuramic acid kinase
MQPVSVRGVDEQHVEALAWAWFARAHVLRLPGNVPAVTGAAGLRVLGSFTPA